MLPHASREYIPLISSPLNPKQPYTVPAHAPSTPGKRRSSQMRGDLSPTERLLRSKAALAWKSTQDGDGAGSRREKARPRVEYGRAGTVAKAPIRKYPAHWDEDNDDVDAFYSDAGEYDYDDDSGETKAWADGITAMRSRLLRDTARRALLMFGLTCLGGCLPIFVLLSSASSPGGVWSLGKSSTQAASA
ncbi:hypothetical protein HYQ44_005538 [Verticillium longisporum]|nr:hypothetical protein HYQ44_005538 [Verticillium longisporum]